MSKVKFGDIVKDVKFNVDRDNNPYEFYVAGDHMDSEDLNIRRRGRFATDDVGPAFTRIFKKGQVLYGSRRTYLKKVAVADFEGITAIALPGAGNANRQLIWQWKVSLPEGKKEC